MESIWFKLHRPYRSAQIVSNIISCYCQLCTRFGINSECRVGARGDHCSKRAFAHGELPFWPIPAVDRYHKGSFPTCSRRRGRCCQSSSINLHGCGIFSRCPAAVMALLLSYLYFKSHTLLVRILNHWYLFAHGLYILSIFHFIEPDFGKDLDIQSQAFKSMST